MRLSDIAAVLTIIAAIIAISTFLAGLWSLPGQEPTPPEPVPPEPVPPEPVPPEPEPPEPEPPEPEPPEPEPPEPEHSITVRVNTYPRTI